MSRIKFEDLPDSLERIFRKAPSTLRELNIISFTPLGVLYMLASDEEAGSEVQRLTGKELAQQALHQLRNSYGGSGQLTATPHTADLVDRAVALAGGPNNPTVGHLLLAMLAADTDAKRLLTGAGVREEMIRQRMAESPSGHGHLVEKFTSVVNLPEDMVVETVGLTSRAMEILAHFKKRSITSVVISGFPGVGRHTLWRYIAKKVQSGQMNGFSNMTIRELNWIALEGEQRPVEVVQKLVQELTGCLILVDDLTLPRISICMPLLKAKTPVIAITTTSEEKKISDMLIGVANIIPLREPRHQDVEEIVKLHLPLLGAHHNLQGEEVNANAVGMLIRFGPAVTGLSLPGGALHLLDFAASHDGNNGNRILEPQDIASLISQITGVPVGALTRSEVEKLQRLPEILGKRVIGQDAAKEAVQKAFIRARAKLRNKRKPIGVFAFLGPTGVGKTELVKALAEALFEDEAALTRVDMSEYQEPHTVARLIGAPPGYVGYEEGGQLTNAVYKNPFQVILLDELDKAHASVFNILLQVMDDGRLTDGKGRTVDFRHAVIIMTSNHGSSLIQAGIQAGQDFEQTRAEAIEWFSRQVRPEFYNRFDEIIVFEPISPGDADKILDLQFEIMVRKPILEQHAIEVCMSAEVRRFLLEKGYSAEFGARPLQRVITDHIVDPLAYKLFAGEQTGIRQIVCELVNGHISFVERR